MKKFFSAAFFVCVFAAPTYSQMKIGYINSEAIMQQLTEAQDAQKQLDAISTDWQAELTRMQTDLQHRFEDYDKKKLIMSDKRRAEVEKELQDLEKKMVDFRTAKFGANGELFTKQNELMKPVQDKLFKAVKDVADEGGYDYVFDKSSTTLLMYSNEKNDLTAKVLAKLQQK
ncbi:MAG TPA: OmpH family outer membrane protein [Bacteroidota bacterium]|nr:OmpH family outer membrane protein [Bacteroidota bacterium]